jgi:tripartite-type tricarboxylate transporter receptor subunit TctC
VTRICTLFAFLFALPCFAQTYPDKPIRFVVAYPPGGAADLLARLLQPKMRDTLGQPVVIEHRGGAGGQIGAQAVSTSAPDGYTIMSTVGPAHLLSKFTAKSLPYDPVRDFTPVTAGIATVLGVAANAAFPPNDVAELIAFAKKNPGKVSFGTTAVGGEAHLSMEYISALGGVQMTHVPYKGGGPAATDLVGGHIPLLVLPVSTVMEHVRKGSVKILGVAYPKRLSILPQVPTIGEKLPAFSSNGSWIAVYGPAKLPAPIANRLHAVMAQALSEQREKVESQGLFVIASTPREFAQQIDGSMDLYAKLVKAANIQPE